MSNLSTLPGVKVSLMDANSHTLSITFETKEALYASYMPFLINGGLFINAPVLTKMKGFTIGKEMLFFLGLLDSAELIPVSGKIAWVTPDRTEGNKPSGFGIKFDDVESAKMIDAIIPNSEDSARTTHTM